MGGVVLPHRPGASSTTPPGIPQAVVPSAAADWQTRRPPLGPPLTTSAEISGLLGHSAAMHVLRTAMVRFAPHARSTLVVGETGAGKATVARALHDLGPRRGGAFVRVPCASLGARTEPMAPGFAPATWASLAGHEAVGAGVPLTLFFDEVADLPRAQQVALIDTLERLDAAGDAGQPSDVQVIAATARDLRTEMAAGRFRSELYYRLSVFELRVPALRDRLDDVPELAEAFLAQIGGRTGRGPVGLTHGATRLLQGTAWPGNLRELRNILERAVLLNDAGPVGERTIRAALASAGTAPAAPATPTSLERSSRLDDAQRAHVRGVLDAAHGNKSVAAARLGISRRALYRLLDKLHA